MSSTVGPDANVAVPIAVKRLLYPVYHRVRNRDTLTVAMFHRVLRRDDPRWDPDLADWTVSDVVFDECLGFFRRHYHVVSLDAVLASYRKQQPLPPRSLLITFDDGYADNEEYALPLLRKHGLPAVVFVYADAVGSRTRTWTDDLLAQYRRGDCTDQDVETLYRALYPDATGPLPDIRGMLTEIVFRGPGLDQAGVRALLARTNLRLNRVSDPPQMLTAEQMRHLQDAGIAIGAHGKTHSAFTHAADLSEEIQAPRRTLPEVLAPNDRKGIPVLAFPYGAYDESIVERTRREGYELVFTTEPHVTELADGALTTPVIGRLDVSAASIAPDGHLREHQLECDFFRAPHARPRHADEYGNAGDRML